MDISNIIYEYLGSNRRITVAGLGTFLSANEDGSILFTEFLVEDDGILRGLLQSAGVTELESVALVERYAAEVKAALQSEGRCDLSKLGVLVQNKGVIVFDGCEVSEVVFSQEEVAAKDVVEKAEEPEAEEAVARKGDPFDRAVKLVVLLVMLASIVLVAYAIYVEWSMGRVSFGERGDALVERALDMIKSVLR